MPTDHIEEELTNVPDWVAQAQREIAEEEGGEATRALEKAEEAPPEPEAPAEEPQATSDVGAEKSLHDPERPTEEQDVDTLTRQRDAILGDLTSARERIREQDQRYQRLVQAVESLEKRLAPEEEQQDPWQEDTPEWAKKVVERLDSRDQQEQAARTIQMLEQKGAQDEANFRERVSDYDDAADFVKEHYVRHYTAQGATPEQLAEIESRMRVQVAANAHQAGQNVAEVVYQHAQALGYTGPPPKAEEAPENPAPPMQKPKAPSPSLSQVGGSSGVKRQSLTDLMEDNPDEFDKIANDERAWKRWLQESASG